MIFQQSMDNAVIVKKNKNRGFSAVFSGIFELVLALLFGLWFLRATSSFALILFFCIRSLSYIPLVMITRFPPVLSRFSHWFSLVLYHVGFIILLLITDQKSSFGSLSMLWYSVFILGSIVPALSFFSIPRIQSELAFMGRPHMRLGIAMIIFALGGVWSGVGAIITFNLYRADWWFFCIVVGSVVSALAAAVGWWWYLRGSVRRIVKSSAFMFWLVLQLGLLVSFWPIGFLFSGLFMAWLWYIIWLTIRYYISNDGISWPRHGYFLAVHAMFMIILLVLIVRWR